MANFSTLFPNLQGNLDFYERSGGTNGGGAANQVYDWAQASNTDTIPMDKLPDISYGDVFTFSGADATLATFITGWNAGTSTASGTQDLHSGDVIIITDTTPNPDEVITYLYVGPTSLRDGSSTDLVAGNFHEIASSITSTEGITRSITSGFLPVANGTNSIINSVVSQAAETINRTTTGAASASGAIVTIPLAAGTAIPANSTFTAGGITIDIGVAFGAEAGNLEVFADDGTDASTVAAAIGSGVTITFTSPTTVSVGGHLSVSRDIEVGGAATFNGQIITLGGGGSTIISAENSVSIQDGTSDLTVGNNLIELEAGNVSLRTVSNGDISLISNGTGEIQVSGEDITAGTDAAPNVLAVGPSGKLQTTNVSVPPGRYTFNTVADGATASVTTAMHNGVIYISQQTSRAAGIDITIANASVAGTWLKIINDSGLSGAAGTSDFVNLSAEFGTDDDLLLNDTSANFEMIWNGTTWSIMAT